MSQPLQQADGGRGARGADHGTSGGGHGAQHAGGAGAAKAAAGVLWVIVGGALAYGITQTAIRAAQLFG